jgi:formyl-CoA transferase
VRHRDELLPMVAEVMARRSCSEWMELLVDHAIPCGPVNDMEHLYSDPQLLHRGMVAAVPHPTIGTLRLAGIPIQFSETPSSIRRPPPLLGEHTEQVLPEVLGYTPQQLEELRRQGAI